MKKDEYVIGDCLCDMHDGFDHLPDNLEVVAHIKLSSLVSRHILNLMSGRQPDNKNLTVVGFDPSYCNIIAAYSYDAKVFGLVELRMKPKLPLTREVSDVT
jgi:hypothetical protein